MSHYCTAYYITTILSFHYLPHMHTCKSCIPLSIVHLQCLLPSVQTLCLVWIMYYCECYFYHCSTAQNHLLFITISNNAVQSTVLYSLCYASEDDIWYMQINSSNIYQSKSEFILLMPLLVIHFMCIYWGTTHAKPFSGLTAIACSL